jgi:hypothetical protein
MPQLRFGKHPPQKDYRTLLMRNYAAALPTPAASYNVLDAVYKKLGVSDPTVLFPMDGNDQYGDCTCAAAAHAITVYQGLIGTKDILAKAATLKTYFHLTGGQDTGLDELNVLNYWQSTGIDKEKLLAFVSIDPKNHTHVQQAIQYFGGVYLGFQVQEGADTQFQNRTPWVPGKLTNDGHAVYAVAYDANQLTVLTWGNTQAATWGWWDECVDEAYALLPPAAEKPGFIPGLDFATLKADLQAVASS